MALKANQKAARIELVLHTLEELYRGLQIPKRAPVDHRLDSSPALRQEAQSRGWQKRFVDRLIEHGIVEWVQLPQGTHFQPKDMLLLKSIIDDYHDSDGLYLSSLVMPDETGGVQLPGKEQAMTEAEQSHNENLSREFENSEDEVGQIGVLLSEIKSLNNAFFKLAQGVNRNDESITGLIDIIKQYLPGLEESVKQLNGTVDQRMGAMNKRIDEAAKRYTELTKQVQSVLQHKSETQIPEEVLAQLERNTSAYTTMGRFFEALTKVQERDRKGHLHQIAEQLKASTEMMKRASDDSSLLLMQVLEALESETKDG